MPSLVAPNIQLADLYTVEAGTGGRVRSKSRVGRVAASSLT